ncbi:MAG: TIM barrel protein [Planctomycetes bacterium]|nr:TIM barrel protein [Planctomycetota bacterium]
MDTERNDRIGRREFLVASGVGLAAVGTGRASEGEQRRGRQRRVRSREEKVKQMASNSYAVNALFRESNQWVEKYGAITLLDFPQFTKDTYEGVVAMDLWSSLFRDEAGGQTRRGFDPATPSAKKYLDKLVANMEKTGVYAKHISNNAPRNLAEPVEEAQRKEGIRVAKVWLDAGKQIGLRSMRCNTGGPQILPQSTREGGYPRNTEVVPYLKAAIESFKELADYGEKTGVRVTIENHWGLAANPMNVRIIINEVGSEFCEASPDFCNWEHEYMLYHGLEALAPLASSMIHAKRWSRYPDVDIARCVQVLNEVNYTGYISLEYEAGGDPVAGTLKLMEDVVAALR